MGKEFPISEYLIIKVLEQLIEVRTLVIST